MKYSNRKISGVWYIKLTINIHYHILVDDKAKILPCNKALSFNMGWWILVFYPDPEARDKI
jgi:hypothetical protein